MAFQILTDMPMPIRPGRAGIPNGVTKYGFERLEIGHCVMFDTTDKMQSVVRGARLFGKRHGKTFASRRLPDGRFGIWRTA